MKLKNRRDPGEKPTSFFTSLADEIGDALGIASPTKRRILADDLAIEAKLISSFDTRDAAESPTNRLKRLDPMRNQCNRLLRDIGLGSEALRTDEIPDGHDWLNHFSWFVAQDRDEQNPELLIQDGTAIRDLGDWVSGLEKLHKSLNRAVAQAESDKAGGQGGARNQGDRTLHDIIRGLMERYEQFTGNRVGTQTDPVTGEATGPFLTFMEMALKGLGWVDITKKSIRRTVREIQRKDKVSGQSGKQT